VKADFNDIFIPTTQCPAQQQLLDYVQGKLSTAAQHEVEKHVADCELCSDALEGLAAIQQKERIPVWVRQMRWQLMHKLRRRRHRRRPADFYIQLILIVLAVLFLLLAGFWTLYFIIR
jgi:anti-sigma factor RsiW